MFLRNCLKTFGNYFWKIILENGLKIIQVVQIHVIFDISLDMKTRTILAVTTAADRVALQLFYWLISSSSFIFRCFLSSPRYLGLNSEGHSIGRGLKKLFSSAVSSQYRSKRLPSQTVKQTSKVTSVTLCKRHCQNQYCELTKLARTKAKPELENISQQNKKPHKQQNRRRPTETTKTLSRRKIQTNTRISSKIAITVVLNNVLWWKKPHENQI